MHVTNTASQWYSQARDTSNIKKTRAHKDFALVCSCVSSKMGMWAEPTYPSVVSTIKGCASAEAHPGFL